VDAETAVTPLEFSGLTVNPPPGRNRRRRRGL
jgi:hypothetical protein